ncbi:MAG: hypothetical protein HQ559_01820 [Lentisphaerae bacterium]|nr:hypothetical protein [Lentisphaerota bacterium]
MLKRFDTLEQQELVDLTDEQVEHYVDVEIALAKTMPVVAPGPEPEPVAMPDKSDIAYEVAGLLFKSKADADAVSVMALLKQEYNYRNGYDYPWLKVLENRTVEQKAFYAKVDIEEQDEALTAYKEAKNVWDKDSRAYTKYRDDTSECRKMVTDAVREACEFVQRVTDAEAVYDKYLRLASGDEETARRLFHDTYHTDDSEKASDPCSVYWAVAKNRQFSEWTPPVTPETEEEDE